MSSEPIHILGFVIASSITLCNTGLKKTDGCSADSDGPGLGKQLRPRGGIFNKVNGSGETAGKI